MKRFGILGGGVAGLSLAYFLGPESEVLEKSAACGGLCRSFEKDGFTYDLGGHVLFSKDKEILDFELDLLDGKLNSFRRRNFIWYKHRLVKYPFENGIGALDLKDRFDCLYQFIASKPGPQHNFKDWVYNTFGRGIADRYLVPYNEKIWKLPLEHMSTYWVDRVPRPPLADVVKSALGIETEGYLHQLNFHYPKQGGFENLPRAFENHVKERITTDYEVNHVEKKADGWLVSNGSDYKEFQQLVVTIPIFDFIRSLQAVPEEVMQATESLRYNSLIVVLVGAKNTKPPGHFGVYIPQKNLLFHRICFYGYFGSSYVPAGSSSIVAEITCRPGDQISQMSDDQIRAAVVDGLCNEGFIEKTNVVTTDIKRVKYAYVVHDLDYEKNLAIVHDYCKNQGIELCGRFAEFRYYNSDAVIRSAKTIAERLNRLGGQDSSSQ